MAVATGKRAFPKGEGRWTKVQANALLRGVEFMFHRRDIDALVKGFTEDCVFRFAEQPEQRGGDALRKFLTARLSRQKNYRLKKTLLALGGIVIDHVADVGPEEELPTQLCEGACLRHPVAEDELDKLGRKPFPLQLVRPELEGGDQRHAALLHHRGQRAVPRTAVERSREGVGEDVD